MKTEWDVFQAREVDGIGGHVWCDVAEAALPSEHRGLFLSSGLLTYGPCLRWCLYGGRRDVPLS